MPKRNHSKNYPLVTVYITTHNRLEKLIRAIESVKKQTYKNIELIVSDDGSTDGTYEYMQSIDTGSLSTVYVRNETPKGANVARNLALKNATGDFITGLDDDDTFDEKRVKLFVENWDDEYALICDNFFDVYYDKKLVRYKSPKDREIFSSKHLMYANLASNQIFTKTSRLKQIGGFNNELKRLQDWDCWIRLCHKFGQGKRFNWCSYNMYHDSEARVSMSQPINDSYKIFVSSNLSIFREHSGDFAEKFILHSKNWRFFDMLKFSNIDEFKFILKSILC